MDIPGDYKAEFDRKVNNLVKAAKELWKDTQSLPRPLDTFFCTFDDLYLELRPECLGSSVTLTPIELVSLSEVLNNSISKFEKSEDDYIKRYQAAVKSSRDVIKKTLDF